MTSPTAEQLDEQIKQCTDVVRISRLATVASVVLAAVVAGLFRSGWAAIPVICAVPSALNLIFHQWQLMKLKLLRQQLG